MPLSEPRRPRSCFLRIFENHGFPLCARTGLTLRLVKCPRSVWGGEPLGFQPASHPGWFPVFFVGGGGEQSSFHRSEDCSPYSPPFMTKKKPETEPVGQRFSLSFSSIPRDHHATQGAETTPLQSRNPTAVRSLREPRPRSTLGTRSLANESTTPPQNPRGRPSLLTQTPQPAKLPPTGSR